MLLRPRLLTSVQDEAKAQLARAAGLDAVQVGNWFINQRKRHWVKQFPSPPQTEQEARGWLAGLLRPHTE